VPELRVVDHELWQRVKLRQTELAKQFEATTKGVRAARAERLNGLRRPVFLLSGLLTCGCCGGKYGIVVNDRYGCLGHFRKGTCDNGRTIRHDDMERLRAGGPCRQAGISRGDGGRGARLRRGNQSPEP